jgi:hypothetical protein
MSVDLDKDLRNYVSYLQSVTSPETADLVVSKPPALSGRRPGWLTATATAVAVLLVLDGAGLLFRNAQPESPPSQGVTSTTLIDSLHYEMDWDFVPRSTGMPCIRSMTRRRRI